MNFKSDKYPWCIVDANSQSFVCERCGQSYKFKVKGMTIDEFCHLSAGFIVLHKCCIEKER